MKLSNIQKSSVWDRFGFYKGRYKTFKVKIHEGGDNWSRKLEYYWVFVDSDKHEVSFNSLWEGSKFNTIEEAKEYAINWIETIGLSKKL